MSRLLDFYRGAGTDVQGRSLATILAWDDVELEAVHDFIQWLFPLPEPSQFNSEAPLLTPVEIAAFRREAILRANLRQAFLRILGFLGLAWTGAGTVVEAENFSKRIPEIWAAFNHNWLRISRILRSLTLLGMDREARAHFERLRDYYENRRFPISANTFQYWMDAVASTKAAAR